MSPIDTLSAVGAHTKQTDIIKSHTNWIGDPCVWCMLRAKHTHTHWTEQSRWVTTLQWVRGDFSVQSIVGYGLHIYDNWILYTARHQLRSSYFMHCILIFFFTDCDLNNRISIELSPLANWSTSIIIHNIEIKLTILHCCLFCCWLHPQKYGTNVALRFTVSVTDQLTNRQNTQIKQWLGLCCCLVLSCCLWPFSVQWPTNVTNDSCWCWLL